MGNIFDSPITMGMIAGTLDVVAAGRVALREEQAKKAAAAQQSAADAQKQLVEYLTKPENYGSAAAYINSNHHSFLPIVGPTSLPASFYVLFFIYFGDTHAPRTR